MAYVPKQYTEEEEEFLFVTSCVFHEGQSFEAYKADVKRSLMLSSWHYSEERAEERMRKHRQYIEEAYRDREPVDSVAAEVGYSCG